MGLVCKSILGKAHTVMAEGGMADGPDECGVNARISQVH